MSIVLLLFALLLLIWVTLTLIYQFNVKLVERLKIGHFSFLIPSWSFFAPNPGTKDDYLILIDRVLFDKSVLLPKQRGSVVFFWHPDKFEQKILTDSIQLFAHAMEDLKTNKLEILQFSTPYLVILRMATWYAAKMNIEEFNFIVAQKQILNESSELEVTFVSKPHRCESA